MCNYGNLWVILIVGWNLISTFVDWLFGFTIVLERERKRMLSFVSDYCLLKIRYFIHL
jgi:hypothetical protein